MQSDRPIVDLKIFGAAGRLSSAVPPPKTNGHGTKNGNGADDDEEEEGAISEPASALPTPRPPPPPGPSMLSPPSLDSYRPNRNAEDRSQPRPYGRDGDRNSNSYRLSRDDRRRGLSPSAARSPPRVAPIAMRTETDTYRPPPRDQPPPLSLTPTSVAPSSDSSVPIRRDPNTLLSPSPSKVPNTYDARRSGGRWPERYVPPASRGEPMGGSSWVRNGYDRRNDNRNWYPPKDVPPPRPRSPSRHERWSPNPPHQLPPRRNDNVDRWERPPRFGDGGRTSSQPDSTFRPPSRMGRPDVPPLSRPDSTEAPPTLLSPPTASTSLPPSQAATSEQAPESQVPQKRSRSPSSPPAGLLKRKTNFDAVVPPADPPTEPATEPVKESVAAIQQAPPGLSAEANTAPGAPRVNTLESPILPSNAGSRVGTGLLHNAGASTIEPGQPSRSQPAQHADGTKVSRVATVCGSLDDPASPSVRLSCIPRQRDSVPMSGRERRRARPQALPLDRRNFLGCSSLDDYEISIKLGQGTFGEVLKGRHILTGIQVALKKVTIHDDKDGLPITALREIKLLKKLRHPSVVPVLDMTYRPSGERGKLGDVYMVEPYMDHDLNGMLENPNIRLEHSQIKLYMKQLLEGTLYLHKNRILHRDMKAANLLINNQGQLQIADFGLARPYRDPGRAWASGGWKGGLNKYTNMVVTRWYRPPELLAGEKKYGPPIDLWGIGCILAEMVTGKPLFKGTSEINQLELISRLCGSPNDTNFPGWSTLPGVKDADPSGRPDPHPEVPGKLEFGAYQRNVKDYFRTVVDVGPECADLIDKLLVLDPTKRMTAQQALDHEWFWTKPFPADPSSLPKYEHSKEIDRQKRDWKPAAQAQVHHQHAPPQQQPMGFRPPPPMAGMPGLNGPPPPNHQPLPAYHYNGPPHDGPRPSAPPFSRANSGYPPPPGNDNISLDYGSAGPRPPPRNPYLRGNNQPYQPPQHAHHRRPYPSHGPPDRRYEGSGGGSGRSSRQFPPGLQPSLPPRPRPPPHEGGARNPYA